MTDTALFPDVGSIQIGSEIVTVKITKYSQKGGTRPTTFVRTFARNFRRYRGILEDYTINLEVTIAGSQFHDIFDQTGSVGSITLEYNGDIPYNLSFFNCYGITFEEESSAEDFLKGTIEFHAAPFDQNGSSNKEIT